MKRKSTKIALLTSILCVVLCGALILGGTFAWFSDEVKTENNIIKSGNLDIELDYYNGADWQDVEADTNLFSSTSWEPGHTEVVYLKVSNVGSLGLAYTLGINVASETESTAVTGDVLKLSDHIQYAVIMNQEPSFTSSAAAVDAADKAYPTKLSTGYTRSRTMDAGKSTCLALVVYMPGSVGNEANFATDAPVPTINLGVKLTATQKAARGGAGTGTVSSGSQEIPVHTDAGEKIATFIVDSASLKDTSSEVAITITPTDKLADGISVGNGQEAASFNIEVSNLKDGNTVPVKVALKVGGGLSGVTVYHKGNLITSTYKPDTGYVTFETLDFSPFTVLFDEIYKAPAVTPDSDLPKANVVQSVEYENVDLPWENYGGWSPTDGLDSRLEAAYTFSCIDTPDEAKASKYAKWYCDFYVMLNQDLGENQIFLGGNYGDFGWVGFHNGDITLEANEEIPLLGSVTKNPWTYEDVAAFVGKFICGVGDVDNALEGATFTVMLRLTNPDDETEFYNVATINYTFTDAVVVNNAEELQDAVNNGSEYIQLGGDIDLSNGSIVIP